MLDKGPSGLSPQGKFLSDVLEWDVQTWSAALTHWEPWMKGGARGDALELGARHGGLSLWLAAKGHRVLCSDLRGPTPNAKRLHDRYGASDRIMYAAIDTTRIPCADNSFDLVCFKSVLGGVGYGGRYDRQQRAVAEMHRVLRPGGLLLFAENLRGSFLHRCLRHYCVQWARDWRYLTVAEVPELFSHFGFLHTTCRGVLATLGRSEGQRSLLHRVDRLLEPLLPDRYKYMIAGVAQK